MRTSCVAGLSFFFAAALSAQASARYIVGAEAYGQGLWYSLRASYRFHDKALVNAGHSYIDIPPGNAGGTTASFHTIPVSLSGLWQVSEQPLYAELLLGATFILGQNRTERTGVRATLTGQAVTPVIGFGLAWLPPQGGFTFRATCYIFEGIDSVGIEARRLPWLGGSVGFAF